MDPEGNTFDYEGSPPGGAATGVAEPYARYCATVLGESLPEDHADSSWFDEMIAPLELTVPRWQDHVPDYPLQSINWGINREGARW